MAIACISVAYDAVMACTPALKTLRNHGGRRLAPALLLFLAACSSGGLKYAPQAQPKVAAVESAVSFEAACNMAPEWAGAVEAALMIHCGTADGFGTQAFSLARAAYNNKTGQFADRQLATNIRLVSDVPAHGQYLFADDYTDGTTRGPGILNGKGVALVRLNPAAREDHHYPPEGLPEPVTLFAESVVTGDGQLEIHLRTVERRGLRSGGWREAAAQAYLHLFGKARLKEVSGLGFFQADHMTSHPDGIYMIEPYDPGRIPLLLIHGLRSNPLIWQPLTVAVMNDPELHNRFQIWHAFYPTGLPPFFNGAQLRRSLHEVLAEFDPEGDDMASRHMALIGHSMGGLITRILATNDNGALWDATFTVPLEQLDATDDQRARFQEILTLRREPQIGFVGFINTPHRGSEMANSLIGKLGSALVHLPKRFENIFKEDEAYLAQTTDAMRPYLKGGGPDAVRVLRPEHPLLRALAALPFDDDLHVASVVGIKGGPDCLKLLPCPATDGVVPYESAHLENADAELVIASAHDGYEKPEAIAFLTEHLKLWLAELDQP